MLFFLLVSVCALIGNARSDVGEVGKTFEPKGIFCSDDLTTEI
jgi:hypothetical protein